MRWHNVIEFIILPEPVVFGEPPERPW